MWRSGSRRSLLSEFQTVGPTTAKAHGCTCPAESVLQRVVDGWSNECVAGRRLGRLEYTARTGSPALGFGDTCAPSYRAYRDPICDTEPVQLRTKELCRTAVVLSRATHHSPRCIHVSLCPVDPRD